MFVGVGVAVDVGVAVVVGVAVAIGDLSVPPGVSGGFEVVLLAGPGCGSPPGLGDAEEPGLGCGSGGGLALCDGWVLGSGGGLLLCVLLADAAGLLDPVDPAAGPACLLTGARWTTSASSTGMPAGRWARALCAAGRTSALVVAVGVGLAVADEHVAVLTGRVPCTPLSSTLTAP